jgi:hypothetical protein
LFGFGLIAWVIFMLEMFWTTTWSWKHSSNGDLMEIFCLFVVPFIVGAILLIGSDIKRN